jgi:hypothetical protein
VAHGVARAAFIVRPTRCSLIRGWRRSTPSREKRPGNVWPLRGRCFEAPRSDVRYCSNACRQSAHRERVDAQRRRLKARSEARKARDVAVVARNAEAVARGREHIRRAAADPDFVAALARRARSPATTTTTCATSSSSKKPTRSNAGPDRTFPAKRTNHVNRTPLEGSCLSSQVQVWVGHTPLRRRCLKVDFLLDVSALARRRDPTRRPF